MFPSCPANSAKFPSANTELGRNSNTEILSQPNPGIRPNGPPCSRTLTSRSHRAQILPEEAIRRRSCQSSLHSFRRYHRFTFTTINTVSIGCMYSTSQDVLYRVTRQVKAYILLTSIWGVPLACLGSSYLQKRPTSRGNSPKFMSTKYRPQPDVSPCTSVHCKSLILTRRRTALL